MDLFSKICVKLVSVKVSLWHVIFIRKMVILRYGKKKITSAIVCSSSSSSSQSGSQIVSLNGCFHYNKIQWHNCLVIERNSLHQIFVIDWTSFRDFVRYRTASCTQKSNVTLWIPLMRNDSKVNYVALKTIVSYVIHFSCRQMNGNSCFVTDSPRPINENMKNWRTSDRIPL